MVGGPRQVVDPPAFTPSPYGLLSVVQQPPTGDPHWQNGITWQSRCPGTDMGSTTYDECITVTGTGLAPVPPSSKADNVNYTVRGATPFTPYVEFDCSTVGNADAAAQAQQALAQSESYLVERAFWTGTAGGQPTVWPHLAANTQMLDTSGYLLQSPAVTGGGAALKPARALGVLEGMLADCYNGVGVIHIPQFVLPMLAGAGFGGIQKQGSQILTGNGNLVAVGPGYPGTSPAGAAAPTNQAWIYATGAVFMYRGQVRATSPSESIDRAENTMKMIAERTYVLGWDCCHVAVLVDLT